MPSFSRSKIQELLQALTPEKKPEPPEGSRLTVHAAFTRFAVLYEKMRNAVDYKDDHLLCKAAITRMLKRHLALDSNPQGVAQKVIRELIAARYLPNGTLPESLVDEAARVVRKYQTVRGERVGGEAHDGWLLGIVSAELEEKLFAREQDKRLVNFLYEQIANRILIKGAEFDDEERRLQIYIACHRALFKADDELLGYKLVRAFQAAWMQPESWWAAPQTMALQMVGVEAKVKQQLRHPLGQKFLAAVKPHAISLTVLRDALHERPGKETAFLDDAEALRKAINIVAERRYKESKARLRRGTVRAMIYLLITKMLLAFALELPFEQLLYGEVHRLSLIINVTFPPVLMFLVGLMIRVPGQDNIERLQQCVAALLSSEGPPLREIKIPKPRRGWTRLVYGLVYAATYLLSFGLVIVGLQALQFTWVSSLIFVFFLCIVSFFAYRLRLSSREYVVVERPEKFTAVLLDFFSLPILRAGRWLSQSISRINIFIFFFDFIVEAPHKKLLSVMEEWAAFMKEKKEELQ